MSVEHVLSAASCSPYQGYSSEQTDKSPALLQPVLHWGLEGQVDDSQARGLGDSAGGRLLRTEDNLAVLASELPALLGRS